MAVTIKDVAKVAGVSTATVSRVINNNSVISTDTLERVKKVMKEMNYFPNNIARNFANQHTYNITLIFDMDNLNAFENPFFYQIQYGIEKVICSRGYNMVIANEKTMVNRENELNRMILEKRSDGIIIPSFILKKSIVKRMEEQKFPFVVIGEPDSSFNVNWVDINNKMAGYIATEHLIKNGYKRIAFIAGNMSDKFNENRLKGYVKAMKHYNIDYSRDMIIEGVSGNDEGYKTMNKLLNVSLKLDAAIYTNNLSAFGAIKAIKENGYKIPEEIGIVSFDSFPVAELSEPNMTTVDIDVFELGIQVGTMILREIELPSDSKQNSLLSVKLISRGSAERVMGS
ncbi:LacI family DNA-binding transcriptional regulator [Clostridium sp.]